MRFKNFTLPLALILVGAVSCSDDDNPVDPNTPTPFTAPPAITMQADLGDLSQKPMESAGVCHIASVAVVAWINLNVAAHLFVPTTAFALAISQDPVFVGDQTWRWTVSGGEYQNAWTAELEAQVQSESEIGESEVHWFMRVSGTQLDLNRFLWFQGTSDNLSHEGYWLFFDAGSEGASEDIVRIDWTLPEVAEEDRSVVFENLDDGTPEKGDRLSYALTDGIASVTFDDASEETTASIQWDTATGAGYATSPEGTCCWGGRPSFPDEPCAP